MQKLQAITINLWFDNEAEEAANFYTSVFKPSKIGKITRYGKEGFDIHKRPAGSVMTVEFTLGNSSFVALNGGPVFKFNEAVSLVINCDTQEEVDYYWNRLSEGGDPKAQQCGWLKDKYGVSWQVVPLVLNTLTANPDSEASQRATKAMLHMKKLDIEKLQSAFDGR